jgi:hypothetical protein
MPIFVEGAVPQLMSVPLTTLTGNYQARKAIMAPIKHDFGATRGKYVQVDLFKRWNSNGITKLGYSREKTQIIGTRNSEALDKSSRVLKLQEFTGPSTPEGEPSTLHLTYEDIVYARNQLWQYGLNEFHNSIGSMNLADNFAAFDDRAHVEELMKCRWKYNPGAKLDANVAGTDKISRSDILRVRELLATLNTPRFPQTGRYHWLISERQFRHLCEDEKFHSFALAAIQSGIPQMAMSSPVLVGQASQPNLATGQGPVAMARQLPAVDYEGFLFICTNTLPKRIIQTANGPQIADLGFAFGPDTVGIASGGKGPQVVIHNDTDFDRHFHFIWRWFGQYEYMLDDDEYSGIAVEIRTYGS